MNLVSVVCENKSTASISHNKELLPRNGCMIFTGGYDLHLHLVELSHRIGVELLVPGEGKASTTARTLYDSDDRETWCFTSNVT